MIGKVFSILNKYRNKRYIDSISGYIEMGDSYFYDSFKLMVNNPVTQKKYLKVGNNTIMDCIITFDSGMGKMSIGNNSWVGNSTFACNSDIQIGDNVFISWGGYICDHDSHSLDYRERELDILQQLKNYKQKKGLLDNKNWSVVETKPINIGSHAWIGMNCIILKGVTIGEGAIVAAGSTVTKDVEPWTVVGGRPARPIKELPENLRKQ